MRIGRYEILCELAQGGMGTVYLGRTEGIGGFERLMAVKMIHPHLSKQQAFIDMFLDEARIAALIRHPNVVPVYEIGEQDGRHYLAMDYVSGEPMSILLDSTWCRGEALDYALVAHVVSVTCEALHAAHELSDPHGRPLHVVHRDVCPQNIMLGYDGVVRVMDFGVAKAVDQLSSTRPGTHKGKVPYMAPEQVRCQSIDRRADVFALGVLLWESTVGKRLFRGPNDVITASRILKGKVPKPASIREDYPDALADIALKALHPKKAQRFQTAREMGNALVEWMAASKASATPSDVEKLLKRVCKRRFEQKHQLEVRAAELDERMIDEPTAELFVGTDAQLPTLDLDAPAGIYEFEKENSDRTVRAELETLGFVGTAEFDLLEDEDEPSDTRVERFDAREAASRKDTSRVQAASDLAPDDELEPDVEPSSPSRLGVAIAAAILLVVILGGGAYALRSGDSEPSMQAAAPRPMPAEARSEPTPLPAPVREPSPPPTAVPPPPPAPAPAPVRSPPPTPPAQVEAAENTPPPPPAPKQRRKKKKRKRKKGRLLVGAADL